MKTKTTPIMTISGLGSWIEGGFLKGGLVMEFFPLVVVSSCVLLAFFWELCQEYGLDEVDTIVRWVVATVTWQRIKAADFFTTH